MSGPFCKCCREQGGGSGVAGLAQKQMDWAGGRRRWGPMANSLQAGQASRGVRALREEHRAGWRAEGWGLGVPQRGCVASGRQLNLSELC